jgi:transcriptional regulator with XRE-family HTH domain
MMTLAEAMQARNIRLCDLSRQSGVSRPTLDGILGKKKVFNKAGVQTGTLLRLAKVLDAEIAIDGTKPYYFELTLRG